MPYVVRLSAYTPSSRDDEQPWTDARIEESPAEAGPWTILETVPLVPVDPDPRHPLTRYFTTEVATLPAGWYRVTFLDGEGEEQPTEPVFNGPSFRPPVSEVAALMPDRTTLEGGGSAGTFTEATTPTAMEVEAVISMVMDALDPRVPADASLEVMRAARSAATIHAAILVETGYFGAQVDVTDARVGVWERLLEQLNEAVDSAARGNEPGGTRAYGVPIGTVVASTFADGIELLP